MSDQSVSDTDRSEVMVLDVETLILDEATDRGIDPSGMEIAESKTSDDHELVVLVKGQSLYSGADHNE
jgi:hypothetical protein